jgi:hypothetical protein
MPQEERKQEQAPRRPHVRVFGVEANSSGGGWKERRAERRKMRQERREKWRTMRNEWRHDGRRRGRGMFWGLALLFAGIILLLGAIGWLPPGFWHAIAPFWPILLILWGMDIIFRHGSFSQFMIFVIALVLAVLIVMYGLIRTSSPLARNLPPNVVNSANSINLQNPLHP